MIRKSTIFLSILLTLLVSLAFLPVEHRSAAVSQSLRPEEDQITAFLAKHPLLTDAQILEVTILGEALVIDLSQDVLPEGVYDEALFFTLQNDLDLALNINQFYVTTFKVAGKPLEQWGRPVPDFEKLIHSLPEMEEPAWVGPLAGIKVALSPGHGLYWHESYSAWMYQRLEFWGIREDTLNLEIMRYVQADLAQYGATVIPLREFDSTQPPGVSGYPAWHEGARQYAISQGLPQWIYDGSNTNYNSDIRARPYMANYYGADLFISLHNNGWDGTLRGTETYWDINNHPGSQAFANAVHSSIIDAIRQTYDPVWINRGVKSSDWSYGEIYFAQMPAILIELAFMDNIVDNAYLHDEAFKILAAQAIVMGICEYVGVDCDAPTPPAPAVDPQVYLPLIVH